MLERFEATKKDFRTKVKQRLGAQRSLRVDDIFYAVRWKGVTYRALSVDALLEKLPTRGTPVAPKEGA